jgi:hypothetical protein
VSTFEILEELPRLSVAELHEIKCRIHELLQSQHDAGLHLERVDGQLVLVGNRVILQSEVDDILRNIP